MGTSGMAYPQFAIPECFSSSLYNDSSAERRRRWMIPSSLYITAGMDIDCLFLDVMVSLSLMDLNTAPTGKFLQIFVDEEDYWEEVDDTLILLHTTPVLQCPCGKGHCRKRTSKTSKYYGRSFYIFPQSMIPPLVDFCLNVDGASKGNPGICGGGGCICDKHGKLLLAFANFYGVGKNIIAETRACMCDGLRLAHFLGVRLSAIYSDLSTLV
ncbi:hypothetical protein Taro_018150 [Colocasia esculenta]|uniref:RNase H type-1 domain-containing protein n=1 Tax=Colocasia esculenta TaxID=4460 RepID=A0A843UT24_COLES|nr:hypothetical protein [Colocasia esculenta]